MENFKPEAKNISIDTLFQDTKNHFLGIENIAIHFENLEKLQFISDENYLKTIIRNLTGNGIKALEKTQNATINWKAWYENGQNYLAITDRAEHKNNSKRCMMTQKSSGLKPDWACT